MVRVAIWFLALLLAQASPPGRLPVPRPPNVANTNSSNSEATAEQELLALANQARGEAGSTPLHADDCLTRAARQHAAMMAARGEISHQFPGEPPFNQRIAASCASPLSEYAENVAEAPDAQGAHEGFMRSPSHRENLLHASYNVAGFGIVRRGPMLYVVQDFGHSLRGYSQPQALNAIADSVSRARSAAGLPRLQQTDDGAAQSEACVLAQADSLNAARSATPGQARYILRYITMQPESLPTAAAKALGDQRVRAFDLGVCFARSSTYPSGAYWVVLRLL